MARGKQMTIGVVPASDSKVFRIAGPFRLILEDTDQPRVKKLKHVIRERPETISDFHDFIRYLSAQIQRAADLLAEAGDAGHKRRAESLRNHALEELQIASRYENDPDRLRACMMRLSRTLVDLKQVANEEEVEGH